MGDDRNAMSHYLVYELAAAHRALHADLNAKLKALGAHVEAWRVLETLSADAAHTMGELAQAVLMHPPTLTKLIDRMVANGLVQRKLAPEDHRRVQLILTDKGAALIEKLRRHADEHNRGIVARLGEENTNRLREALRALV